MIYGIMKYTFQHFSRPKIIIIEIWKENCCSKEKSAMVSKLYKSSSFLV
jgi:hypothetical protein